MGLVLYTLFSHSSTCGC